MLLENLGQVPSVVATTNEIFGKAVPLVSALHMVSTGYSHARQAHTSVWLLQQGSNFIAMSSVFVGCVRVSV